jgi:hypothetical protein
MQQHKIAAEGEKNGRRVATFVEKFYDIVSHPNFSNNVVVGPQRGFRGFWGFLVCWAGFWFFLL